MSDKYYGALYYQWYWLLILPLLIGVFFVLRNAINHFANKKPKAQPVYIPLPVNPVPPISLIKQYALTAIQQLVTEFTQQKVDSRGVHQHLNAILKEFVWRVTGDDVRSATLAELRQGKYLSLVRALELQYPEAFGPDPIEQVGKAAEYATRVVREWN